MATVPPAGGYQPQNWGYQPAPGYPPPGPVRVRPGRVWYLLALAVLAAGVVWLVTAIVSLTSTIDGMQRVALPGGGTVTLTHSGGYTIYYEGPGAQTGLISPFNVNIASASPGAAVSHLNRYGPASLTYSFGSHQGRAVLTVNVTHPGRFAVTATGTPAAGSDLAFGGSIGHGIGALLPSIPLILLGILAAVILFVIRIARTRSLRRGFR